jgi:predicted HicB family RNase H-like nuclease
MSKEKAEKKPIMAYMPEELRKQVEESAERLGQSLSTWLERAAQSRIEATKNIRA